ncbi:hypothetical protein VMCG_07988 [Cytospora schulzeri]|uniref:Uncharacterized protein n=1 Tax=Cytospora schulzeri TaxID=448051 RepID=A0A423VY87_9PEZI|nr:hypothetical protein VMCG_07988 [Valsa malicola]
MSNDADLYVSNGTCYYGQGQVSDPRYIPCGNAYLSGIQHCCFEGDYCLSSYACYDTPAGVTYLAGCTDPTFLDAQCAQKPGYSGQQWVAMARCDGANVSLWTGCDHHAKQITLEKENCECNTSNVLIKNTDGLSSLNQIGSLPTSAGGTISFNPTALPSYAAATTGNSSTGASGAATATATGATSGGHQHNLTAGQKAGISVGSIVGGLLIIGLLFFAIRRVYRSKLEKAVEAVQTGAAAPPGPQSQPVSQASMAPRYVSPQTIKSDEESQVGGFGYKPEMPVDGTFTSELQGDEGEKPARTPLELPAQ